MPTPLSPRKILYSAVVLDEKSHDLLITTFSDEIGDLKIYAHHMTINLGELPEDMKGEIGKEATLTVTDFAYNDLVCAVKVNGYPSKNAIPHVTLAVNIAEGGQPRMSNDLTNWVPVKHLTLTGTVQEITS